MMRYFVGIFLTIGLIILLIVLLLPHGGGDGGVASPKAKVPITDKALIAYANTDTVVRLTIDGPVNAPQDHRQAVITVGKDQTTFDQVQGYDNSVTNHQTYPNTQSGYSSFLHALAHAGFTKGDTKPADQDERGYCPTGNRYIFELIKNGDDVERFWSTSCGKPKTYQGNNSLTLQLFKAQVPDYDKQSSTLGLNF